MNSVKVKLFASGVMVGYLVYRTLHPPKQVLLRPKRANTLFETGKNDPTWHLKNAYVCARYIPHLHLRSRDTIRWAKEVREEVFKYATNA